MKACFDCGILLDAGDWFVEIEATDEWPEEVTCTKCHKARERSDAIYQSQLMDIDRRESELAEEEGGDLY